MTDKKATPRTIEHFIMLDFIRFFAAVIVMGLHLGFWGWWKTGDALGTVAELFPNYPEFPEGVSLFWFGWVGVQIFFVISGLVITMSAENSSALSFARSRFLRIYPAAWICATLSLFIIVYVLGGFDASTMLSYANSLLLSPYPKWIDGVYWTLALELVFYGTVFLILAAGRKQQLILFGLALGSVSSLYIAGLSADMVPTGWFFTLLLLRHGVFFAVGMLMWKIGRAAGKAPWPYYAFLLVFAFIGALEIRHAAIEKLDALNFVAPLWPPIAMWLTAAAIIFASVIWSQASNRLLYPAKGVLRILGLATYPLYLIHQTVGGLTGSLAMNVGLHRHLAFGLAALVSTATAILIAMALEPMLRRFAGRKFDAITAAVFRGQNRAKYG